MQPTKIKSTILLTPLRRPGGYELRPWGDDVAALAALMTDLENFAYEVVA